MQTDATFPITNTPRNEFKKHFLFSKLLELPDKIPDSMYHKGFFPPEHFHILTIVGSRKMSQYGKEVLESLISGLAGQDICIVSGLAMGVDGEAHRLALKHKMHTIAVPGSGIAEKAIYPKINKDLSDEILLNGGMLLSEFEPEFTATDWSFPARNRIMASISDAVLIIEASERSGTLITARLALDYNKDLMAVPASIFSNNAKGSNDLIRQGAIVINSAEDILHNLGIKVDTTTPTTTFKGGNESSKNLDLSELEKKILNLLKENMSKDKLIQNLSEVEVGEVLMSITMLELKGFIKEEIGFVRRVR